MSGAALRAAASVDALLRGRGAFGAGRGHVPWAELTAILVLCGWIHGAAMGSSDVRVWQAVFSAVKVPVLLTGACLVVLPNFVVVNTLLGLRDDLGAALRGVLAAQATVAVALCALAPVLVFVYVSGAEYDAAIVLNGAVFAVATACGQATLARHYRPLVARNPRHRIGKAVWLVLYVFVAIQLAWVLRPFIGSPGRPTRFFREDAWSNAYVVVWGQTARFVSGDDRR